MYVEKKSMGSKVKRSSEETNVSTMNTEPSISETASAVTSEPSKDDRGHSSAGYECPSNLGSGEIKKKEMNNMTDPQGTDGFKI